MTTDKTLNRTQHFTCRNASNTHGNERSDLKHVTKSFYAPSHRPIIKLRNGNHLCSDKRIRDNVHKTKNYEITNYELRSYKPRNTRQSLPPCFLSKLSINRVQHPFGPWILTVRTSRKIFRDCTHPQKSDTRILMVSIMSCWCYLKNY